MCSANALNRLELALHLLLCPQTEMYIDREYLDLTVNSDQDLFQPLYPRSNPQYDGV